jgi:hypothetical protein
MDHLIHHQLDLVHREDLNEWCLVLDGHDVLGFNGPGARELAERQRTELNLLLSADAPPVGENDHAGT